MTSGQCFAWSSANSRWSAGLLEGVVLQDGPAADDLLGLGVGPVDPGDLAVADHEVHGVLSAVGPPPSGKNSLGSTLADVGVHRVEQRLGRGTDALFHPHESHETRHLDHSYWLLGVASRTYVERLRGLRHRPLRFSSQLARFSGRGRPAPPIVSMLSAVIGSSTSCRCTAPAAMIPVCCPRSSGVIVVTLASYVSPINRPRPPGRVTRTAAVASTVPPLRYGRVDLGLHLGELLDRIVVDAPPDVQGRRPAARCSACEGCSTPT